MTQWKTIYSSAKCTKYPIVTDIKWPFKVFQGHVFWGQWKADGTTYRYIMMLALSLKVPKIWALYRRVSRAENGAERAKRSDKRSGKVSGSRKKRGKRSGARSGRSQSGRSRSGSGAVNLPHMAAKACCPINFLVCPHFHPDDQSWSLFNDRKRHRQFVVHFEPRPCRERD